MPWPDCTTDCTNADGDGYCVTTDCDDGNANCTTDCTDSDGDGYCDTTDCDEINANYRLTLESNGKLTNLLQSAVKLDAERADLIGSISSQLEINDEIEEIHTRLRSLSQP